MSKAMPSELLAASQNYRAGTRVDGDPQIYSYHPLSGLALGKGFHPSDVVATKPHFLTFTPRQSDAGSGTSQVKTYYVRDNLSFQASLKLDSKVTASYLGAKGAANWNFSFSTDYNYDSVTISITCQADYGRWSVGTDYALRPDAAALLAADRKQFFQNYGTRYVESERRGAQVCVFVTITSASQSFKSAFSTAASAEGGYGPLSGSAEQMFAAELAMAKKQQRIRVDVFSTGANAASLKSAIESLVNVNENPYQAILAATANAIGALTPTDGVPMLYYIADTAAVTGIPSNDLWSDYKELRLQELAEVYDSVSEELHMLRQLSDSTTTYGILARTVMPPEILIEFAQQQPRLTSYLREIADGHRALKTGAVDDVTIGPRLRVLQLSVLAGFSGPRHRFEIGVRLESGEHYTFNDTELRRVMLAPYRDRFEAARRVVPNMRGVAVTCGYDGIGLVSRQVKFSYNDGDIKETEWVLEDGRGARVWGVYHPGGPSKEGVEWWLQDFAAKHKGQWTVDVYENVRDIAKREFRMQLCRMSFTANGTDLQSFQIDVVI